jgi:hypothetical protein
MRSDLIAMSPKEIGRLECLQLLAQGTIRQAEAARKLGLTARFAVSPRDPHDAHRTLPQDIDLRNIMARRQQRKLSQQLTFSCGKTIYQILTTERRLVFPKATIELIETLDGELVVQRNGQTLPYEAVRERPKLPQILDAKQLADHPRKPPQKPSPDHPWKSRGLCSALGIAHPRDISNLQAGDITDLR